MRTIEQNRLKNDQFQSKGNAAEGQCPVCWGYQQYDSQIRILQEDKQIDVNNHQRSYMRIQRMLKKYIVGTRLREGIIEDCPRCGSPVGN